MRSGSDHAIYAATFGEVAEGELLVYSGSAGALTLAVNRGDAARRLEPRRATRFASSRRDRLRRPHLHLRSTDSTNELALELADGGAPRGPS